MKALRNQTRLTYLIWGVLAVEAVLGLLTWRLMVSFVALGTLALSMVPPLVSERLHIALPKGIVTASVLFIFATLFLGEVYDFYERVWWWDIMLHGLSAMGFGILGFLAVFILFEGDRYAAPPWALGLLAFCVAMTIGALWEVFEFGMDQLFGLNMQRSGLVDTMSDLIVNAVGAALGGLVAFLFLIGRNLGGVSGMIHEFLRLNRRLFGRFRR